MMLLLSRLEVTIEAVSVVRVISSSALLVALTISTV